MSGLGTQSDLAPSSDRAELRVDGSDAPRIIIRHHSIHIGAGFLLESENPDFWYALQISVHGRLVVSRGSCDGRTVGNAPHVLW